MQTDIDEPSAIPADFAIRRGVSFGVSNSHDFTNAHYNSNPYFIYCPKGDGGWTVRFTWVLVANGRLPHGTILIAVPLEATGIRTVGGSVDVKDKGQRLQSDKKPLQPTVIKKNNYALIRYSPKDGIRLLYERQGVIAQETAVFGIVFDLPSTRIVRKGLGEWTFQLPYQGRLGALDQDIPSTIGAAQDRLQDNGPLAADLLLSLKSAREIPSSDSAAAYPHPLILILKHIHGALQLIGSYS